MPYNELTPNMKKYLELFIMMMTGLLISCAGKDCYGGIMGRF
jgi:hypothetical protein